MLILSRTNEKTHTTFTWMKNIEAVRATIYKKQTMKRNERKHGPDNRSDSEIANGNIGGGTAICNPELIPSALDCDPVITGRNIAVFY